MQWTQAARGERLAFGQSALLKVPSAIQSQANNYVFNLFT